MIKQEISVEYTISENDNYPAEVHATGNCVRFLFHKRDDIVNAIYDCIPYKLHVSTERLALPSELKIVVKGIDDMKDADEIEGTIESVVEFLINYCYIAELNKND